MAYGKMHPVVTLKSMYLNSNEYNKLYICAFLFKKTKKNKNKKHFEIGTMKLLPTYKPIYGQTFFDKTPDVTCVKPLIHVLMSWILYLTSQSCYLYVNY